MKMRVAQSLQRASQHQTNITKHAFSLVKYIANMCRMSQGSFMSWICVKIVIHF